MTVRRTARRLRGPHVTILIANLPAERDRRVIRQCLTLEEHGYQLLAEEAEVRRVAQRHQQHRHEHDQERSHEQVAEPGMPGPADAGGEAPATRGPCGWPALHYVGGHGVSTVKPWFSA